MSKLDAAIEAATERITTAKGHKNVTQGREAKGVLIGLRQAQSIIEELESEISRLAGTADPAPGDEDAAAWLDRQYPLVGEETSFSTRDMLRAYNAGRLGDKRVVGLAQQFHELYEQLAPDYGYTTRRESAVPWDELPAPNRMLLLAVCKRILQVGE